MTDAELLNRLGEHVQGTKLRYLRDPEIFAWCTQQHSLPERYTPEIKKGGKKVTQKAINDANLAFIKDKQLEFSRDKTEAEESKEEMDVKPKKDTKSSGDFGEGLGLELLYLRGDVHIHKQKRIQGVSIIPDITTSTAYVEVKMGVIGGTAHDKLVSTAHKYWTKCPEDREVIILLCGQEVIKAAHDNALLKESEKNIKQQAFYDMFSPQVRFVTIRQFAIEIARKIMRV